MSDLDPPAKKDNTVLKVLGIGCLVVAVFAIAGIAFVAMNARDWAASGARELITEVIEESEMPAEQKSALTTRTEELTEDFRQKRITLEELGRIGSELADGPVANLGILMAIHSAALNDSDLSTDQRDAATRAFQRFGRGVEEGTIPPSALSNVLDPLYEVDDRGRRLNIGDISSADRDALIAELVTAADAAGVPDEAHQVDYVALFDAAVRRARGG